MKVAMLSYPMLFQTQGGLQIQVLESIEALKHRGVEAELIDPNIRHLTEFDVIHIFSAINGNQRIAEHAKAFGLPVVTSPLIRPHWNRKLGRRGRLLESIAGRLTHWTIRTEYQQIASCLRNSDVLLALGEVERRSIAAAFDIPDERVRVVPNGIPARFFTAEPSLAREKIGSDQDFLLCVATIDTHKNQLALARATAKLGRRLVLAGECLPVNQPYLDQLLAFPHVNYLGKMDYQDPLLASLYAAAGVFCLTSHSEVMPLCVLEALAAGTPVVTTRHHCMNLSGTEGSVVEIEPTQEASIATAISSLATARPDPNRCRAAVKNHTWDAVAELIHHAYIDALRHNKPLRS